MRDISRRNIYPNANLTCTARSRAAIAMNIDYFSMRSDSYQTRRLRILISSYMSDPVQNPLKTFLARRKLQTVTLNKQSHFLFGLGERPS